MNCESQIVNTHQYESQMNIYNCEYICCKCECDLDCHSVSVCMVCQICFLHIFLHFSMLACSVLTLVLICLLSCVGSFKVSGLTCYVKPDADTPCPHQPCETLTLCKQCGWFLHNKYVFKGTHLFRINRLLLVGNISGLTLRNWLDDHGNYHMQ